MRIRNIVLLIILNAICGSEAYTQNQVGLTFGGPQNDRGVHVIKTSDNYLLVVGVTEVQSKDENVFVVKTDLNGKKIWEKNFGGDKNDVGWDIVETDGGKNYLISGWSESYSKEGDEDILLLKISRDGNLIWTKTLPGKGNERCWSITKLKDGNFILTGQTQNITDRIMNGLITKIDKGGNVMWQKKYGEAKYNRLFYSEETYAGEIFVSGIQRKDSASENNGLILLLDKSGLQKRTVILSSVKNITTHGILKISGNEILIYGYAQTDTAINQRAIYFSMFDGKGNLKWEKVTDEKDSENHGIGAILTASGSIILTGYSRHLNAKTWDGIIYKFSRQGEMLWRKLFGGSNSDQPYSLAEISKNEFMVTGLTRSFGVGGADLWLVKFNEKGEAIN